MNEAYAKFYNPLKRLAVDDVIVKFKGRDLQAVHSKENVLASKFTNSVMNQGIHMT
jgi:hypothetical protein